MTFQLASFLLGVGAAWGLPVVSRILRPMLVEVLAAGMTVAEEAQRVVAEQMETFEDIAAEARARREASAGHDLEEGTGEADGPEAGERPARRRSGSRRAS